MMHEIQRQTLREGHCPSCAGPIVKRAKAFYASDVGHMDGLVCEPCNALWDDPDNSFTEAVRLARVTA